MTSAGDTRPAHTSGRQIPPLICNDVNFMRRGRVFMAAIATAVLVAACGDPQYRSARNDVEKVYVRVPHSWTVFDRTDEFYDEEQTANSAVQPIQVWVIDSAEAADPRNVEEVDRDTPVGTAQVFEIVTQDLAENVSIASVRSLGFDFDPAAPPEDQADNWRVTVNQPLQTERGISGSVIMFDRRDSPDDPWISQARGVFVDPAGERLYLLDLFCTKECFDEHYDQIFDVLDSWRINP
jgi:hypothetical protein